MLLQIAALEVAVAVLKALGVPVPTVFSGIHHAGGIAGSAGGVQRQVNPAIFAGAMRFHTGGIAGLAPDEVPAILQRGEEVLTQGDPRHRANAGLPTAQAAPSSLKIVNTFDPEDAAKQLLSTRAGERTILNMIRTNPRAFKAALG